MRRFTFLVNPASGSRSAQHDPPVASRLRELCPDAEILLTRFPGHARALAAERRGSADQVVVAVGGDGTVSEVAGALLGGQALLGVIPAGSGNDFARMLDLPRGLDALVQWMQSAAARACDIARVRIEKSDGSVSDSLFVNSLGIGFEAVVADSAARIPVLRGFARYLAAALGHLMTYRASPMRLVFNDQVVDQKQFLVAIGNGRWAGGGFMLTPHASIDDGLLELTRADDLSLLRLLWILPRVFSGRHLGCSGVHAERVRRIAVDCPDGLMVHGDGEIIARCAVRLDVEVLPGALRVLG